LDEKSALEVCGVSLKRELLAKLRLKAQRCKAWFKLKRDERRLMDLVITVVEKIHSFFLARILSPIIKKLLDAVGSARVLGVAYLMKTEGRSLAQKLSWIAQGWGNKSAATWPRDPGFVRYLTVMDLNKLP
jgi:hypothetical protein